MRKLRVTTTTAPKVSRCPRGRDERAQVPPRACRDRKPSPQPDLPFPSPPSLQPRVEPSKLVFGQTTTDHILEVDWDVESGYHAPTITPYHPLVLDPACNVFHYATEAFEGMKAYLDKDGRVRLFRPDLNMRRMAHSMRTLSLPELDREGFLECIKRLVLVEKGWIPRGEGFSLYLRPTVIGTQPTLGVSQSRRCKLFTICSPVGPYYPEGFKPVKLLAEKDNVRAWPGGVGHSKLGGNYAPTIRVQAEAAKRGYAQVLWLFGKEQQVTEVGTMNFFVLWRRRDGEVELVTAPLDDGTILPGVTRTSILDLARSWGEFKVTEGHFTIHDVVEAAKEGRIIECFGAGTAAVVSPVRLISYDGVDHDIPLDPQDKSAGAGKLTRRIWDSLLAIQYGKVEHPWSVVIG